MLVSLVTFLRPVSRWLFWPAVALVVWGELTPSPPPELKDFWDKAEHFTAYGGLAGMASLALGLQRRLAWAILGILVLGGTLEILQTYTGRDGDILDMAANTLGVIAGLGAAAGLLTLVARRGGD